MTDIPEDEDPESLFGSLSEEALVALFGINGDDVITLLETAGNETLFRLANGEFAGPGGAVGNDTEASSILVEDILPDDSFVFDFKTESLLIGSDVSTFG